MKLNVKWAQKNKNCMIETVIESINLLLGGVKHWYLAITEFTNWKEKATNLNIIPVSQMIIRAIAPKDTWSRTVKWDDR